MSRNCKEEMVLKLKFAASCIVKRIKKILMYISKNWIWIIAGLILTWVSAVLAYAQRCYFAYGGEYLALPLVLMAVEMVRNIEKVLYELFGMEDDSGSGKN